MALVRNVGLPLKEKYTKDTGVKVPCRVKANLYYVKEKFTSGSSKVGFPTAVE